MGKSAEENEQLRIFVEISQAKMKDNGHEIQAESLVETERDLEIRGLQAGDGRRGSIASQSHGCCLDATIFKQFVAMGAEQAVYQISAIQGDLSNILEVQYQPLPVKMREENKTRRSKENRRAMILGCQCLWLQGNAGQRK